MLKMFMMVYSMLMKKVGGAISVVENFPSGYSYKGSVEDETDLPNNAQVGDMYTVEAEDNEEYIWNGTEWITPESDKVTSLTVKSLWSGTREQYEEIGTPDPKTLYFIKEEED